MVYAIILAGGKGTRVNADIPKQFIEVCGKPIIAYTLEKFNAIPTVDGIVGVCVSGYEERLAKVARDFNVDKMVGVTTGGTSYGDSIGKASDTFPVFARMTMSLLSISLRHRYFPTIV